jgi:PEP-CTERM motif
MNSGNGRFLGLKGFVVVAVILGATFLGAKPASAGSTVYNQPASFPSGQACPCWTSDLPSSGGGFVTWDNFSLSSTTNITSATWQGFYFTYPTAGNGSPNTNEWGIYFYSNASGAPGTLLGGSTVLASAVSATLAGTYTGAPSICGPNGCSVYDFSIAGLSAFKANAGTEYWFTVVSYQPTFSPVFTWALGSGGDGNSYQCSYNDGASCYTVTGDRAFSLDGTAVSATPEPSSILLFGTSLLGLAQFRRKLFGR